MTPISATALRAGALAKLGGHEDPRSARVLRDGVLSVEHHVSQWEASSGRVIAHRVRVGVPAALLGALRGHPHVEDEVTRIIGVVVSDQPGEAASDVLFHHEPALSARLSTPYRGALPGAEPGQLDLPALASDYLVAFGEDDAAAIARRARIEVAPRVGRKGHSHQDVHLILAREDERASGTTQLAIENCLRDLLEGPQFAGEAGAAGAASVFRRAPIRFT